MASSGKPTAVHFTLIFFVMLSVILGVVAYMFYNDHTKAVADHNERKTQVDTLEATVRRQNQQLANLKSRIGYDNLEVGELDDQDRTTLLGSMWRDMIELGSRDPSAGSMTLQATLLDLSERVNRRARGEAEKQLALNTKDGELDNLRDNTQQTITTHQQAVTKAQDDLRKEQAEKEESIRAKDQVISQLRDDLSTTRQDLSREKEERENESKDLKDEIVSLNQANDVLNEKLADATRQSFEIPDGVVRMVDQNTKLVWINLGEEDGLQTRTTFSVYTKDNQGVGRDPEDIKGSIEVERIVGPHLAQCRILRSDSARPITREDPIYSPLWSPGRSEVFSIVGLIDVNGDGRSDRELIREFVAAVGARFDNEVDDEGNRIGTGISIDTKFLIVGELPDPAEATTQAEQKVARQIQNHYSDMLKEARFNGVRRVRLNDFLDYVGYRPEKRLWRPGEDFPLDNDQENRRDYDPVTGRLSRRFGGEDTKTYDSDN